MPDDGDANVLEVIGGQLGQNVGRNLVPLERLPVALQPQLSQPRQDIHGVPRLGNQPAALTLSERRSAHHQSGRGQITSATALVEMGLAD